MADKPETPQILDQIAKGTGAKNASRSTRSQQTARRRFYLLLFLFIPVIGGLAYLAYFQMNVQSQLLALEEQNSGLLGSVAAYENEMSALALQIEELPLQVQPDTSASEALDALNNLNQRLETEVNGLRLELESLRNEQREVEGPQPPRWKILEADYLVNLASRKLQLESDIGSAISLLQQADQALQDSGSNNIFTARQALSTDIDSLNSIESIDREGLYIQLENLMSRLTELSLLGSMRENFESRQGQDISMPDDSSGMLDQALTFLGSIFVWRRWDETPEAMLIPGQDSLIRQRIRLTLELAQTALARNDARLYQQGLRDGIAQIEQYAEPNSPQSQYMIAELTSMLEINISPPLPTLAASRDSVGQLAAGLR